MKNKTLTNLSLRKALLSALVVAPLATMPAPVWAVLPDTSSANLTSSAGAATVIAKPNTTTLSITTPDRTVLTWGGGGGYSVAGGDTHIFNLPSTTASVLNRVTQNATAIDGTLISNGRVFILNPNGITVGATGVINTTGLGLSTINEADFNFVNSGQLGYVGTVGGNVTIADGAGISVGSSGNVTLAGNVISFAGTIAAGTLNVDARATGGTGVTIGSANSGGWSGESDDLLRKSLWHSEHRNRR
jgi:filamentous hemagglutinin family protein